MNEHIQAALVSLAYNQTDEASVQALVSIATSLDRIATALEGPSS
ncbi:MULTISPECIES: hypothetical protein [unclassified Microbacterium]|nr:MULTISPECIES: hypothetical protein [unclassified Microbacterium]